MSHKGRNDPAFPDLVDSFEDEPSSIRSRGGGPTHPQAPLRRPTSAGPPATRSHSGTRPATGSLDDRLERKMRSAGELLQGLPSTDTRVRLLYVAIMRRDEALLDGVLAALKKPPAR